MQNKMKNKVLSTIYLLSSLAFFGSCSSEKDEYPETGEGLVSVPLNFGGITYGSDETPTSRSIEEPATATVTLENGQTLEATLDEDPNVETRAAEALNNNASILMIAYLDGKLYRRAIITPATSSVQLPTGNCKLVFYSYNSTTTPTATLSAGSVDADGLFSNGAALNDISEVNGQDPIFATVSTTIAPGVTLGTVNFSHLFSRVKVIINGQPADQYGLFYDCSAEARSAYSQASVKLSDPSAWTGTGSINPAFTFTGIGSQAVTSEYLNMISSNSNFVVYVNSMTIRGQTFSGKSFDFGKALEKGKSYTITLNAKRPTYTLSFDLNGGDPGEGESMETTYAARTGITISTQQILSTYPVKSGYIFSGWTSSVPVNRLSETEGSGTQLGGDGGYFWMPGSDVKLTANWIALTVNSSLSATCNAEGVASYTIAANFYTGQTYQLKFTNADSGTSVIRFTANGTATTFTQTDNDAANMHLSNDIAYVYNNGTYTWNIKLIPVNLSGLVDLIEEQKCQENKLKGLCTNPAYIKLAEAYCAKTCGIAVPYLLCGTSADSKEVDCAGKANFCTDPTYVLIMRAYCPATCHIPTGDVTVDCEITTVQ